MVEVVGKIVEQSISILIYPGSTHSYITPRVVEICVFKKVKHRKSWLVQLATGTKRKVNEVVDKCPLVMNGLVTCVDLNVLPLGSYDVLIGMDWLEAHRVKLDCYNKTFECMNEEGNPVVVKGIPKVIFVRHILVMQLKNFCRKGCQLYAAHIEEVAVNETLNLEDYHVLQEFKDVFPNDILGILPKRDMDFTFELVLEATPVSKSPYRMSTPEMLELKMQLQELLEKKYIN